MTSVTLISSILRGKWLVDPDYALAQGTLISSILNKNLSIEKQERDEMSAYAVLASGGRGVKYSWSKGFDKAPKNSVAVISIKGALMKEDADCGPLGTATIGSIIQEADSHSNIDAIVLNIDSPGGTVDGTEALANIVKNTQKPIISYVDGMMASAALWIGSAADEIMASTDTDDVGSVGVLSSFADFQPYYEKLGVKFHVITATKSPDKVKMWEDVRAGKYDEYRKEVLDPIDEKFMNAIKVNRPAVEEKHLTAKLFFARDVMGVFVDSIGTLDDAIARAIELTRNRAESTNLNNKNAMEQFKHLNAVLGVESLESVDEAVSLNADQLQELDTALGNTAQVTAERDTAVTERDAAIGERNTATAERDTAAGERETATTERDNARTELTAALGLFDAIDQSVATAETPEAKAGAIRALLAARPGAKAEVNLDASDPEETSTDADWDTINSLPHNQAVDRNL